jgi:integrase
MRGHMKQRYPGSWSLTFDLGPGIDPKTGQFKKRRQKCETFRGNKREAEERLGELVRQVNRNQYVRPSKLTLAEWLVGPRPDGHPCWLDSLRARIGRGITATTVALYERTIDKHMAPSTLGQMRLQRISALDVETYCSSLPLATGTIDLHRTILLQAFKAAKKGRLIAGDNPVRESDRIKGDSTLPSRQRPPSAWDSSEAQVFLKVAKLAGSQPAALYSLALDSGARKGELLGLRWSDVDLGAGTISIAQQLIANGPPTFGPPKSATDRKTGKPRPPRAIDLDTETVRLLSAHKRAQAEIKMRLRTTYQDQWDLVFAKDDGSPLALKSIGQGEFARIVSAAGIRAIRFHDMRHTCATLLLLAGEPVHVVSHRLGHANPTITMNVYAHVLKQQATKAGRTIGALIHGGK